LAFDSAGPAPGSGTIAVQITRAEQPGAISGTAVWLKGPADTALQTDTTGFFTVTGLPAGRYELTARRIGYVPRHDSLTLQAGAGTWVRVALVPQTLDGPCSGFAAVRVRKPWWRLW